MLDYTEYTCPVCHRPFGAQDDVVVCPHCGAPHHRQCWQDAGQCAFADTHGTAEQWRPAVRRGDDDAVVCGNCGFVNPREAEICGKCGHTLEEELPPSPAEQQPPVDAGVFYSEFSPYIGIAPDSMMYGEKAMDIATYLGPRSGFYLSRFHFMRMSKTKKSWNWAAALFPATWLLYRKMYKAFAVALGILLLMAIPYLPYILSVIGQTTPSTIQEALISGVLPEPPFWLYMYSRILFVLTFFLRALWACAANHVYQTHVLKDIRRIRTECTDPLCYRFTLSRCGGTNPLAVILFCALCILLLAAVIVCGVMFIRP